MENYKIVTHKGGRGRFLLGAVSGIFLQIQWGECTRAREKRGSPYHTFSHMHGHLHVLRVSLDGLREKGRLLVAYGRLREVSNYKVLTETFLVSLIGVISLMELRWSLRREVTHGATWRFLCRFWDNPTLAELWVKKTWHNTGHIHLSDFVKTWPLGLRLNSPRTALTVGGWITP